MVAAGPQREDRCMTTPALQHRTVGNTLRARPADFFRMDVPRSSCHTPARDSKPLRRSLSTLQDLDACVSPAELCPALWQLMDRA